MMRRLALLAVAAVAMAETSIAQPLSAQTKSQWDGVYTTAQAARGEELYVEYCATCHGEALNGGEMAPALAGGEFTANWNELSLGDLFERMRVSMPQDNPGSLSRQQNADILAFVLSRGNYPAGKAELPAEVEALWPYQFLAFDPNGR